MVFRNSRMILAALKAMLAIRGVNLNQTATALQISLHSNLVEYNVNKGWMRWKTRRHQKATEVPVGFTASCLQFSQFSALKLKI